MGSASRRDHEPDRAALIRKLTRKGDLRVTDPCVLRALRTIPRDRFVADDTRSVAWENRALPIACGQTISQPLIVGLMTEWIVPRKGMRVLEVGTGSGYQTAVLLELGCIVFGIERHARLHREAGGRLQAMGYHGFTLKHGDGYAGWPEHAPFDAILAACRIDDLPPPWEDQVVLGGRLVAPVGGPSGQVLRALRKESSGWVEEHACGVQFVPLLRGVSDTP